MNSGTACIRAAPHSSATIGFGTNTEQVELSASTMQYMQGGGLVLGKNGTSQSMKAM